MQALISMTINSYCALGQQTRMTTQDIRCGLDLQEGVVRACAPSNLFTTGAVCRVSSRVIPDTWCRPALPQRSIQHTRSDNAGHGFIEKNKNWKGVSGNTCCAPNNLSTIGVIGRTSGWTHMTPLF